MEGETNLVERLAERVGATSRSTRAFGPVVARDGVTVIPVARIGYGFGGGAGDKGEGARSGSGGGGGGQVEPVGYIRIIGKKVTWHPILIPRNVASAMAMVFVGAGIGLWFGLRGAAALEQVRSTRRR